MEPTLDLAAEPSVATAAAAPRARQKRRQIADSLRTLIAGLNAGDRLPSVAELEKRFGVAKATVEAAVGELQNEGLVLRRQGAGTFVAGRAAAAAAHLPAQAPPTGGRARVGRMMITSVPRPGFPDIFSLMAAALAEEMRRSGYDPLLHFDNSPERRLIEAQRRWERGELDGYIHIGSADGMTAFPDVPGVFLGEVPAAAPVHQVVVDNYGGGRLVGEYLWGLGHRRVTFVSLQNLAPGAPRLRGLADAMAEHGGDPGDVAFFPIPSWDGGRGVFDALDAGLRPLLAGPRAPTALFLGNDQIALPSLQALLSWGVRVPEELSVVSFDDTPGLADLARPALTGLRMPAAALGALAVQTLDQAVQNPGLPFQRLRLPAELIVRESVVAAPSPG